MKTAASAAISLQLKAYGRHATRKKPSIPVCTSALRTLSRANSNTQNPSQDRKKHIFSSRVLITARLLLRLLISSSKDLSPRGDDNPTAGTARKL